MWHILFTILALAGLGLCLASPILYFVGKVGEDNFKNLFLIASISWFIFGSLWFTSKKKNREEEKSEIRETQNEKR